MVLAYSPPPPPKCQLMAGIRSLVRCLPPFFFGRSLRYRFCFAIYICNIYIYVAFWLGQVQAPAKAGAIAPIDVFISPQNTGLGPEKTSFFQALSIATKISRGTIEILSSVHLVKKDEKVGFSEAALLQMLKIFPFSYGLRIKHGK